MYPYLHYTEYRWWKNAISLEQICIKFSVYNVKCYHNCNKICSSLIQVILHRCEYPHLNSMIDICTARIASEFFVDSTQSVRFYDFYCILTVKTSSGYQHNIAIFGNTHCRDHTLNRAQHFTRNKTGNRNAHIYIAHFKRAVEISGEKHSYTLTR